MELEGRRIVLGVTGGIAAYKAVEVCRRLVDAGAFVSPILTKAASKMVGPTTFSALASEPTKTDLWNDSDVIPHTKLGQQADLVLVCPATARSIADLRIGRSGDLLSATLIATEAPIVVCPAMHTEMWQNAAVQENIAVLRSRGITIVGPGAGVLAGGDEGVGRLADVDEIVAAVNAILNSEGDADDGGSKDSGSDEGVSDEAAHAKSLAADFRGVTVLVTAGGTREPIDPVRFLSNRSSGRQGHAIAEKASERGAEVILITASDLPAADGIATRVNVDTGAEMAAAVAQYRSTTDVFIMAAAVADFRPVSVAPEKLKKVDGPPEITLVANEDILLSVGEQKEPGQLVVGFAAETADVESNAEAKLEAKHADVIVANDVSAPGVGFDHATNEVTIVQTDGTRDKITLRSKREVAIAILDVVARIRAAST